jgi:SAM-dependent methyltransferase
MLVSYDTAATWEAEYRAPGQQPGFNREGFEAYIYERWGLLLDSRNWNPSHSVLIVGCAYGWAIEYLLGRGFTTVWGTDISAFIQATKGAQSAVPDRILPHDARTTTGRNAIRTATGVNNNWRLILTEDVLPCYTDADALAFAQALRGMLHAQGTLAHIVSCHEPPEHAMDPAYNRKSLAEWTAFLAPDTVVGAHELNAAGGGTP